jgi:cell division protease FtsH
MKNTSKVSLIALAVAALSLFILAFAGKFSQKPTYGLPEEAAHMRTISKGELDNLLVTNRGDIKKVIFYKGMPAIVADVSPLGYALIEYGSTDNLLAKLKAQHVAVEIADPVAVCPAWPITSLHWSFWALLGLCALGITGLLWRQGVFSKVPGMEVFTPIDAGCTTNPQDFRDFEDVAGCEEAIAKLKRVARWLKSPEWYEQFGAKIPKGILAVGPPGTGKTLLARSLAGEVDANFFAVHGSSFVEMYVGVGARRVRRLFAAAVVAHKRTGKPSIIFIDEIDAIGKKRGQGGGNGGDSERDQTLNQLLVCMQGFEATTGIIVMAATNMPSALDEALTRPGRFDYQVSVDLPDTLGREKIFSIHTKNMKIAANVRLRDLAIRTPQFSGADIEQACNEAAMSAADRLDRSHEGLDHYDVAHTDMVLTLEDFDTGIDYVQFGDPMLSRARSMSQEDKRNTAFHEAGHCAVQQALQAHGADPITKVTIEPRTKSLGSMQSHSVGDRYCYTQEQLLARIATAMGGRAAQEHFLGRKDTGAANDFEQATNFAKLMVAEFGMANLEPMFVKIGEDGRGARLGGELANDIDKEWRRILAEGYRRAMDLVIQNERRVERIAETLLAEQTILGERFLQLWGDDENRPGPNASRHESDEAREALSAVFSDMS